MAEQSLIDKKFKRIFWIHSIGILFFLVQNELMFSVRTYHPFLLTMIGMCLLADFIYEKTKNYNIGCGILFSTAVMSATVLIYAAGAHKAPGLFQVALITMASGLIFGKRGIKYGFILSLCILGLLIFLGHNYPATPFDFHYQTEKITNTIVFLIISYLFVLTYTNHIEEKEKQINLQSREIDNLLKILIHDIATPVSVVGLRLDIFVREKILSDEQAHLVKPHLNKIRDILDNVKKLKQVASGKLALETKVVNVQQLIASLTIDYSDMLIKKNIDLKVDVKGDLTINTDPLILKTNILGNLLSNSIKFSEEGGRIDLNVFSEKANIIFTVKDYGTGVDDLILPSLFKSDVATTQLGTHGERGTGFGLPIVKNMVDILGGEITVKTDTSEKSWTEMRVIFPVS